MNANKRQRIIERIKKSLAMAKDTSSPREAAIAAKQARAMMDKYQIDSGEIDETIKKESVQFSAEEDYRTYKRPPRWYTSLTIYISELNDCQVVKGHSGLVIRGISTDVELTKVLLKWLAEVIEKEATFLGPVGRARKDSFKMGYAQGVNQQVKSILKERKTKKIGTGTSLMVVKKQLVENEFGVVRYKRSYYSPKSSSEFSKGVSRGSSVELHNKVNA